MAQPLAAAGESHPASTALPRNLRSRVTNGKSLFVEGDGRGP